MDKVMLKVAGVIALIVGIIYCLSIVFLILGIPLIIGAVKFLDYSKLEDVELLDHKDEILVWSIVFLFLTFISGILGIVFYLQLADYKEKTIQKETKKLEEKSSEEPKKSPAKTKSASKTTTKKTTTSSPKKTSTTKPTKKTTTTKKSQATKKTTSTKKTETK